jgi:chemotaxis protein MotB
VNFLAHDRFAKDEETRTLGWMISYADMMTIILTFMILLLSISTIAQTKYDLLIQAFTGERLGNLHEVQDAIDQIVEERTLTGEVRTFLDDDGLKIEFSNALLFESGSAELRPEAEDVFGPIRYHLAERLGANYGLVIQGYTDDVPISSGRFRSNWELSTSRAIHVMEELAAAGLDMRRMSVEGFADTRPATDVDLLDEVGLAALSPAELEVARAANRRVVIRIDTLPSERVEHILSTPTRQMLTTPQPSVPDEETH